MSKARTGTGDVAHDFLEIFDNVDNFLDNSTIVLYYKIALNHRDDERANCQFDE
jgi:hypothetical protein